MPRNVRVAVTQVKCEIPSTESLETIKKAMIETHLGLIDEAAQQGVRILCLQELFYGPYFCAEQNPRWYQATERVPDGPTLKLMQDVARKHKMALVVPVYEEEMTGVYYNTAAVLDSDGSYLGKYRKTHIPHCLPGFWEKFYFTPGDLGYPTFDVHVGGPTGEPVRVGVYICYDRHFPEGARALGLAGAEVVFIPSATTAGHSEYLWEIEQRSHAVANGYFVATNNRVGREQPWNIGEFYGSSYICDPRGNYLGGGKAARDRNALVAADCDLDLIGQVRAQWQFYRDRRPDLYGSLSSIHVGHGSGRK
jgi:N-carbamoylputrescine amidase